MPVKSCRSGSRSVFISYFKPYPDPVYFSQSPLTTHGARATPSATRRVAHRLPRCSVAAQPRAPGGGHLSKRPKHVEAAGPGHAHCCLSCVCARPVLRAHVTDDVATATSSPCPPHMVSLLPLAPILRRLSISALPASAAESVRRASPYARFFLRAPRLMATKPVLIGATERRAPQLLHCMK